MKWTSRMDVYLRAVSTGNMCPTYEEFVLQIRLQLLANKAVNIREQLREDHAIGISLGNTPTSAFLYYKALRLQLQQLKTNMSPWLQQQGLYKGHLALVADTVYLCVTLSANKTLRLQTFSWRIFLTQSYALMKQRTALPPRCHFLHHNRVTPGGSNGSSGTSMEMGTPPSSQPSFDWRLDCLWRSLHAIAAWFDYYISLPSSVYLGFSFPFCAQLSRCIMTLFRLSTLRDPAWDLQEVDRVLNMRRVLDQVEQRMELAATAAREEQAQQEDEEEGMGGSATNSNGTSGGESLFTYTVKFIRMARAYIATKMLIDETMDASAAGWPHVGGDDAAATAGVRLGPGEDLTDIPGGLGLVLPIK
ncbi:hypothetical protein BX600DRAFT_505588 [Xylariales sp. PMI_506]|nr:hypothetical protein BX600DRAFT_505588 [Xylariales sp. PMI_506]